MNPNVKKMIAVGWMLSLTVGVALLSWATWPICVVVAVCVLILCALSVTFGVTSWALRQLFPTLFTLLLLAAPAFADDAANAELVATGRQIGVQSILTGQPHPDLQLAAEAHALYMARHGIQGHQGWDGRLATLVRKVLGYRNFREVANESWPGQSQEEAAKEMYKSWKTSAGHWASVNGRCAHYGYAMVRGANGTWYACGIFCDK